MRSLFTFIVAFIISATSLAQGNIALNDLLDEARSKLYSQPEQTGKIAAYIISQNEPNPTYVQAMLLLAKSHYVRSNYNEAVKNAMDAKRLSDDKRDYGIRTKANIFALKLFRNLDLEGVANKYREELTLLSEKIKDRNLSLQIQGALKKDKALIYVHSEDYSSANKALAQARSLFSEINDSTAIYNVDLTLAEISVLNGKPDTAQIQLDALKDHPLKTFHKLRKMEVRGNLLFDNKEYEDAISIFHKVLSVSLSLPNKEYEHKALKGLSTSYLALEDTKNFFLYKQRENAVATQLETDRNLAVNSIYNFIDSYQKEKSEEEIQKTYITIYALIALFIIILLIGLTIHYIYNSKTKEYKAIYKYLAPKKTPPPSAGKVTKIKKRSTVPGETEQVLLKKLDKFESGTAYTKPEMSIAMLAAQFDTNTKYLSEVINREKGKNFNAYINELRIQYIIDKLNTDPVYFNYKISYLAEESGFSSHSSFATVFKSVTGVSPTKFMDFLKQRKETA